MEQQIINIGLVIGRMAGKCLLVCGPWLYWCAYWWGFIPADGIVDMIELGTDCVGEFCTVLSLFAKPPSTVSKEQTETIKLTKSEADAALAQLTAKVVDKKAQLLALEASHAAAARKHSAAVLQNKAQELHKVLNFIALFLANSSPGSPAPVEVPLVAVGGPMDAFGEFAEMVDVCMKMCKLVADMCTDQVGVMAHISDEILNLSKDIVTTSGYIVDMSANIVSMEGKMVETEELMVDLVDCISTSH
jgi:hypothetical protein